MKRTGDNYSISELARELDISPSAIRFYEDKGLISPLRTQGNQRVYTPKNRARLKLIIRGKRFGASLDEIAEMIGREGAELDETFQIEKSLAHIEKKFKEIERHKEEIVLFERDLLSLREKLLKRRGELDKDPARRTE